MTTTHNQPPNQYDNNPNNFRPTPYDQEPEKKGLSRGTKIGVWAAGIAMTGAAIFGGAKVMGSNNNEAGPSVPSTSAPANPGETEPTVADLPPPTPETVIIPNPIDGSETTGLKNFTNQFAVTASQFPATKYEHGAMSQKPPVSEMAAAAKLLENLNVAANLGADEKTHDRYSQQETNALFDKAANRILFNDDVNLDSTNQLAVKLDQERDYNQQMQNEGTPTVSHYEVVSPVKPGSVRYEKEVYANVDVVHTISTKDGDPTLTENLKLELVLGNDSGAWRIFGSRIVEQE